MVTNSLMSPIVFKTASTLLETVFFMTVHLSLNKNIITQRIYLFIMRYIDASKLVYTAPVCHEERTAEALWTQFYPTMWNLNVIGHKTISQSWQKASDYKMNLKRKHYISLECSCPTFVLQVLAKYNIHVGLYLSMGFLLLEQQPRYLMTKVINNLQT